MNEIRNTKYERRGFTLIELVVAIGVMAMVVVFAGTVFKTSIAAYRVATAQAEIMQKFRAITDQLNNDFRGLRKNAPLFIWFQLDPNDPNKRLDQIMFFADGDFQSVGQWANKTIVGNLARIQYGQARSYDYRCKSPNDPQNLHGNYRLLARRQQISTTETDLNSWPDQVNFLNPNNAFNLYNNDLYEYDRFSLSQWQALTNDLTSGPANVNQIITACFTSRPVVDLVDTNDPHMLMAEKVGSFSVQWSYAYINAGQEYIYWWPSIDPCSSGNTTYSDFGSSGMNTNLNPFGFYFNTVAPFPLIANWFSYATATGFYYPVIKPVYPQALKFTFTLYDSQGVFKDGQTFTHIVYLGD
ncbi:MAG: prepilin-type N-terminal cleavage/methylation domain-containing protein [Sedimentisphaerales bacterium]|jgi:prepilin-type N-terminal cleavage/methylation domain-containing protein